MVERRPSRVVTTVAVGFLLLDGVLLGFAGLWSRRAGLIGWGVVLLVAAAVVVVAWRHHVRRWRELHVDLEAKRRELEQLHRHLDGQSPS